MIFNSYSSMTYHIRHSLLGLGLCLMSAPFLGACGSDEPVAGAPDVRENSYDIKFAISVGSESATRTEADEEGSPAENRIDVNDLKILVFGEDETLFDVIYDNGYLTTSHNEVIAGPHLIADKYYYFSVSLNPAFYDKDKKFAIVALANWHGAVSDPRLARHFGDLKIGLDGVGELTISQLEDAVFDLNKDSQTEGKAIVSWIPGDGQWIPMFGSKFCSLEDYDSGIYNRFNPMSLDDIDLVRAFAKIEVINNDTSPDAPAISKIELMSRNVRGRFMQDFDFGSSTSQVPSISLPTADTYSTDAVLFNRQDDRYVAYMPELELQNHSDRRKAVRITLDLGGGKYDEKWLWLAPYADSRPVLTGPFSGVWQDIRRNHIYRYTITSLGFDFQIDCDAWRQGGRWHIDFE